ncbi:MAG: TetR/AcrR family transcriptional regulator [Planctomycetota bacterium]
MSERKQQILAVAAEILENKSFAAFSYQDLADRLGIRKASIHHHFPSKDELGVELLKFFEVRANTLMGEIVGGASSPGEALRAIFSKCEQVLLDGEAKVCPSAAFEIDARNLSPAVIDQLRSSSVSWQKQLAQLLDEARRAGDIAFLGDVHDQAATIANALQGARISEAIMGRDHFRGVVRQLQRSLGL